MGEELPFPQNITAVGKYETKDYIIKSAMYAPNANWNYNLTRYFEILVDGILICHSTAKPNYYDESVCNLYSEINLGDTLVFSNEGNEYHT